MATRSITYVHDGDDKSPVIVAMYRHFDGHFDSHGHALENFLSKKALINGINCQDKYSDFANGMGDLAAQLVCHFKKGCAVGGFYLRAFGDGDTDEEYVYRIYSEDDVLYLKGSHYKTSFKTSFTKKFNSKKVEKVTH